MYEAKKIHTKYCVACPQRLLLNLENFSVGGARLWDTLEYNFTSFIEYFS